jgi:thiol:disulfide interchange protein/DsbC/DsbD-like thiol-disulfide interchange protein
MPGRLGWVRRAGWPAGKNIVLTNRRLWHLISVRRNVAVVTAAGCLVILIHLVALGQTDFSSFSPGSSLNSKKHHTQVKLILDADQFYPGSGSQPVALLDLKMDPGWHTYWKNGGDAGTPTKIDWQLPPGVSVLSSAWPVPEKLPPAEVTTYGYEGEAVLPTFLQIASNTPPGHLTIKAHVTWLECKETCLPADADVEASLDVISPGAAMPSLAEAAAADPERARVIDRWQHSMPLPQKWVANEVRAWWETPTAADSRPVVIEWAGQPADADFYPDANDHFEIEGATEVFHPAGGTLGLRKTVKKFDGGWPPSISGLLVLPHTTNAPGVTNGFRYIVAYDVTLPVASGPPPEPSPALSSHAAAPTASGSPIRQETANLSSNGKGGFPFLLQMLAAAFLGGLILNIMPCVLPVIALKILGFVSEARSEPRRVRLLGFVYTLGVLASFLVLAGLVIAVKAAGHHPGWGMQFSSPIFVVCLATLVLLVALNLFGVFEVALGGRALDAASGLTARHGVAGAFFNGVLATALATPCTAPFLASALGFAFTQSTAVIVVIFVAAGLGLSAPYLLLSWQPAWLRFLPKPGVWMEKFKHAMGFPMLATTVWLFTVAMSSYGKDVLWLGLFLVTVALAAWVFGEFFQRGRQHRALAAVIAVVLLAGGYVFALEKELDWRNPMAAPPADSAGETRNSIAWQPWTPQAVAAARAAGHPVLVDFTADWCLTCQVNRKTSIEIPAVSAKLKAIGAVALVGDYTHAPEAITTELNRFDRAGVPLVLVYPREPSAAPIVLPALLTPGIVLAALDKAK